MIPDIDRQTRVIEAVSQKISDLRKEIHKVIVGQSEMIDRMLIGLFTGGHLILEGLPGLAKTLAVNTLAKVIQCDFKRVQFTPDLLPADLIGTSIYNLQEASFTVKKGPIFTNILLADEINRAPPKVQSALLEVMQEKQVTIGGETFFVDSPYMVLATQNPIEQEGTYPLPEAQTDRFMMKVVLNYPTMEEEKLIIERMAVTGAVPLVEPKMNAADILSIRKIIAGIYVDEKIIDYILQIVFATRNPGAYNVEEIAGLLLYGASPRACIALKSAAMGHAFLQRRAYVTPQDVIEMAPDVLRHRLKLSYEAEAENISADAVISKILSAIPIP